MTTVIDDLPPEIRERSQIVNDAPLNADGDYVLYWMHHAMRAHDNPALDAAILLSQQSGKPVLVYQGLAGHHPFNSDRHHLFILQGARDVAQALKRRGIRYAFHLPADPDDDSPLHALLDGAVGGVFEQMPVAPFNRWQPAASRRADVPVIAVDARCIVPMQWLGRACDRAFRFRDALKEEFPQRIAAGWHDADGVGDTLAEQQVFESIGIDEMTDRELLERIAELPINHAIGPVADTPGGSAAGYQRWQTFRDAGLKRYHKLRNDAAETWPLGVSRMSAYLHYGQVSPFRLAAEAANSGGAGADKFIEELTVWRELAHNFCFHCKDPDSLAALPDWAQKTLAAHRDDRRDKQLSLYQLQQADSGVELWDLAQRSLIAQGELHNNLRMTWAKAIVAWTRTPEKALQGLIDLNHRYALDGNDPSSYGGLLWALGLFDRPFKPDKPVLGTLRGRSVSAHAKRLDMESYREHVERSQGQRLRVAVIGAGVAGLSAARALDDHNHEVVVIEKSRGPGGRSATRRREEARFDHGAQYFTARNERFSRHLESWLEDGVIESWPQRLVEINAGKVSEKDDGRRFRGVGGMNALNKQLARGLELHTSCRVTAITSIDGRWRLDIDSAAATRPRGDFDAVLVSAPATQAAELLATAAPELAERAGAVQFSPTWAVMLQTEPVGADHWQAAFVNNSAIAWIGGRNSADGKSVSWVVHASETWSGEHLEDDAETVADALASAFSETTGLEVIGDSVVAHRWRFARVQQPLTDGCLFDPDALIGACGDWCHGPSRIEAAWLSGQALAGRVLAESSLRAAPGGGVQHSLL